MSFKRKRWMVALPLALLVFGMARAAGTESFFAASLTTPKGDDVSLASWRGKPLIVMFRSPNCEACKADSAELDRLAKSRTDLSVLSIVILERHRGQDQDTPQIVAGHPVLATNNRKGIWLMQNLGNPGGSVPFTVSIDRQGKLVSATTKTLTPASALEAANHALR